MRNARRNVRRNVSPNVIHLISAEMRFRNKINRKEWKK
jgi:hypothetical protein